MFELSATFDALEVECKWLGKVEGDPGGDGMLRDPRDTEEGAGAHHHGSRSRKHASKHGTDIMTTESKGIFPSLLTLSHSIIPPLLFSPC